MKTYQDTETGKLWSFENNIDLKKLKNRRIPKTLTIDIIEKPSKEYIWHKGDWIHKKEAPEGYEEPLSSVPRFNPAWISFLFPLGTFLLPDNESTLDISLENINSNSYNGGKFKTISLSIQLHENISKLPILLSYDGSLAIPRNKEVSTVDQAVSLINKIKSALFIGGILVETTDHKEIECGSLSDDGQSINSYMTSEYNRLRSNQSSLSELSVLISPNYIKASQFKDALDIGTQVSNHISNLSIEFIMRGYSALIAWNTSDALNNLWIAVEQLTSYIWNRDIELKFSELPEQMQLDIIKNNTGNIFAKHKFLKGSNILESNCFDKLSTARKSRNNLVHQGLLPEIKVVEDLWFAIFDLLHLASDTILINLLNNTSYIESEKRCFRKHYPPRFSDVRQVNNLDFSEWEEYKNKCYVKPKLHKIHPSVKTKHPTKHPPNTPPNTTKHPHQTKHPSEPKHPNTPVNESPLLKCISHQKNYTPKITPQCKKIHFLEYLKLK